MGAFAEAGFDLRRMKDEGFKFQVSSFRDEGRGNLTEERREKTLHEKASDYFGGIRVKPCTGCEGSGVSWNNGVAACPKCSDGFGRYIPRKLHVC